MKFAIIQIVREINFGDCRSAKLAVLTAFRGAEFGFLWILHFLKVEIYQIDKIQSP